MLGNGQIQSFYKLQLTTVYAVLTNLTRFVLCLVNRYNLSRIFISPSNFTAANAVLGTLVFNYFF